MNIFTLFILILITTCTFALEITPPKWELGVIPNDKVETKICTIKNTSDKKIVIFLNGQRCSCIRFYLQEKTLLPGQQTKLEIVFLPQNEIGFYEWQLLIETNLNEKVVFPISAHILQKSLISKTQIDFGTLKKNNLHTCSKSVSLVCPFKKNFSLNKVYTTNKNFLVSVQEKEISDLYPGKQRGFNIDINIDSQIDFGHHVGQIILETDIPQHEIIKIDIFIFVVGDLKAIPNYLVLGFVNKNQKITKRVTLYHEKYKEFSITHIEKSTNITNVLVEEITPKKYFNIFIEIDPNQIKTSGEFREIIYVFTDNPGQKMIPIYLQGFYKE